MLWLVVIIKLLGTGMALFVAGVCRNSLERSIESEGPLSAVEQRRAENLKQIVFFVIMLVLLFAIWVTP